MANLTFIKMDSFFKKEKFLFFLLLITSCLLMSCASSDVSRDAASNVDFGIQNAKDLVDDAGDGSIGDTYYNTSQLTKGALIGGAAGAITGGVTSGVGVIPGTAVGAILGASYGSYIDSKMSLKDQLENRGAVVVVIGDQILIAIPSARLFNPWTAKIKRQAYPLINLLVRYVNGYTKILVKIAAYTSDTGSKNMDLSLSQQQAACVAKALSASGIDARLLYAAGYGGTKLMTTNSFDWDTDNYRIEITLEKLYV